MTTEIVLTVRNLKKLFPITRGLLQILIRRQQNYIHAVDGIDFDIKKGEIFGLVGESGCGKSTTARMIAGLIEPTSGKIYFKGVDMLTLITKEPKKLRREIQMVFQDPFESLNPRMNVFELVAEPLDIHRIVRTRSEKETLINDILKDLELVPPEEFSQRYPHQLSGGQRQRVALARSLILRPSFLIADEPVSMLDVSVRTGILKLLLRIREKFGITQLFITHDLAVARQICTRITVMYLGKIVESGETSEVIDNPSHPYTKALISAVPVPDPTAKGIKLLAKGDIPSAVNPPSGCRFHPRCQFAKDVCSKVEPILEEVKKGHYVACHLFR